MLYITETANLIYLHLQSTSYVIVIVATWSLD